MDASHRSVELTQELLRFDTINPPGAEEPCARHIGALLEPHGFRLHYHSIGPGRTNLIATIGGASDKPPICFTGHIDVVPLGAAPWTKQPFAGEMDGPNIYGRGSSDMKSGVAAFVCAAIALADKLQRSPGLSLVITAGEETGCEGAFKLIKDPALLGRAGAMVVAEPTSNSPHLGHKGAFWMCAKTKGVTAHGSMPDKGVNAVYAAARAVTKLEGYRFNTPAHPIMGKGTLNVGTFKGGLNINSVPDRAEIGIDMRTVPNQNHKHIHSELCELLGPEVELETLLDVGSIYSDPDSEWIQKVYEIMTPYLGARPTPHVGTYFTDAAALKPAFGNPPTVILGPGEDVMAHKTDEYCVAERVRQSTDAFVQIMRDWCRV